MILPQLLLESLHWRRMSEDFGYFNWNLKSQMLLVRADAQVQSCIRVCSYCLLLSVNVLIPEKKPMFLAVCIWHSLCSHRNSDWKEIKGGCFPSRAWQRMYPCVFYVRIQKTRYKHLDVAEVEAVKYLRQKGIVWWNINAMDDSILHWQDCPGFAWKEGVCKFMRLCW